MRGSEPHKPDATSISDRGLFSLLAGNLSPGVMVGKRVFSASSASYAVDLAELLRRMADDVHQILKGAKPGNIPIYQPLPGSPAPAIGPGTPTKLGTHAQSRGTRRGFFLPSE
jgi:hypothetical protein